VTDLDLSEFESLSNPRKRRCSIGSALETLGSDAERDQLRAALCADRFTITPGAVVKWLERRGLSANTSAVVHHRNGACSCAGDGSTV
jgi:hypothetical protein